MAVVPMSENVRGAAPIEIVAMRRRHLRSVLRIEALSYPRPWAMSLFLSELALRSSRAYLVARSGSVVVGYAGAMLAAGDGHVTTIAVDPPWRRHRVGQLLLAALVESTVARGGTAMTLEVRASNEAAQAMYRKFGFAPIGVRRGYYPETGEDGIVMWLTELTSPGVIRRVTGLRDDAMSGSR